MNERIERIIFQGVDQISGVTKTGAKAVADLRGALSSVQGALAGIGVTVGAGAFVALHMDVLKATAALDDMAESTGASVEKLSAIRNVARVGGQDFEGLTSQIGRMIKGLKDGSDEGGKAASALKFLGVSAKDSNGHFRDTAQIIIEAAKSMDKFADDGKKVMLIQDLLGKGAERYAPLLNDIAKGTDLVSKTTKEQAAAAEEAEKNINRLKVAMEDSRRELVNDLTPAIVDFTTKLLDAKAAAGGFIPGLATMLSSDASSMDTINQRLGEIEKELATKSAAAKATDERSYTPGFLNLGGAALKVQVGRLVAERDYLERVRTSRMKQLGQGLAEDAAGNVGPEPAKPRADYFSPGEGERLSPEKIAQMQAAGQEVFNEEVKKANVEMYKWLDDQQKKYLVNHVQNVMDAYDREQELAIQTGAEIIAADSTSYSQKRDMLLEYLGEKGELEQRAFQQRLDFVMSFSDAELQELGGRDAIREGMYAEHAARMNAIDLQKNETTRQMEMQTWSLAAGFLQLFAGKSKAAALAVLAIQKGLAIAGVIVNTQAAVARAYFEMGPYAGSVMAAYLESQMAAQIALIGATGLVEAAGVAGSGGGSPPTGSGGGGPQPVFEANPFSGSPAQPVPRQSITIILPQGEPADTFTLAQLREFAEKMADASEGGARIFVEQG